MKLTHIAVRNFRSLGFGDAGEFNTELSEGTNVFVGPNNIGKSNLFRALALAFDPTWPFDAHADISSPMTSNAVPRVTLTFQANKGTSVEKTLLTRARAYERSVKPKGAVWADDGIVKYSVSYTGPIEKGKQRRQVFMPRGVGNRLGNPELSDRLLRQFRRAVRFVLVESGQDLRSLLGGQFREILHSVLLEHLRDELDRAGKRRDRYVDDLRNDILAPLTASVTDVVAGLFPEISGVELDPDVPAIDRTLSNVGIKLSDAAVTSLEAKGTGVRGGVLVAMLRYLAEHGKRSMVFAVEEPEAFLHPGAQEVLAADLEALAERKDVTLLVTTHSPFIVSRHEKAQVFGLRKDVSGNTIIVDRARGDEPQARNLGGLFRDQSVSHLLERGLEIPSSADGVLLVEGETDRDYLSLAVRHLTPNPIESLHIIPTSGASSLVLQAVLVRSACNIPVIALLDSDAMGRRAGKQLLELGFEKSDIIYYGVVYHPHWTDIEAEDLFPNALIKRFIKRNGGLEALSGEMSPRHKKIGGYHYGFGEVGKGAISSYVSANATPGDFKLWHGLIERIAARIDEAGE